MTTPTPRLEDIAAHVGCSISTVSRALAGNSSISVQMCGRIEQVATQLGYSLPVAGRKPRKAKTRTIGIVIDVLQNNPLMTQLLEHLDAALHEAGYRAILIMESMLQRGRLSDARPLIDSFLDGMIFASATLGSRIVADLQARGMPLVLVLRSTGAQSVDTVEIDNVHAGAQAAQLLHDLGHRRIGLVMGPRNTSTSHDRAQGALTCLDGAGIPGERLPVSWGEYTSESGYSATMALLSNPEPVSAIFAGNDMVAIGVLEAARRHGVDVPGQLSVIGFDDIPLARSPLISLTTVRQPVEAMARLAARRLVDRLEMRGPAQPVHDFLPGRLVQRGSIAGPAPHHPAGSER